MEGDLQELGTRIVSKSGTLAAVRSRLIALESAVGGIGTPEVNALPGRLEELVRMIEVALDTGSGGLPMRLHGSGARSLSSLQIQGGLYDRRLGRDGSDLPTHPVTLLEEPESHLHPQACFDLGALLDAVPGQVVASTHSSHLVTVAPTESLRLVRCVDGKTILRDLNPVDAATTSPAALRVGVSIVEWEKLKRSIERPFGEVLFANAIVVGDGASERAFLPHLVRCALRNVAAGVCVVDPGGMSQAVPFLKYADAAGIPCVLFCDSDQAGRTDEQMLPGYAERVWVTGDRNTDGTLETVLADFDSDWCVAQCGALLATVEGTAVERLTKLKGTYGGPLGRAFVEQFPDPALWPQGFRDLVVALGPVVSTAQLPAEA